MWDPFRAQREERMAERRAERAAFLEALDTIRDVVTSMAETQKAFYSQFHTAQPAQGWTNDDLKEAEQEAQEMADRLAQLEKGHTMVDLPSLAQLMGTAMND